MKPLTTLSAAFIIFLSAIVTEATRLYIAMPFDLIWMFAEK
jgi:hypothetical protein